MDGYLHTRYEQLEVLLNRKIELYESGIKDLDYKLMDKQLDITESRLRAKIIKRGEKTIIAPKQEFLKRLKQEEGRVPHRDDIDIEYKELFNEIESLSQEARSELKSESDLLRTLNAQKRRIKRELKPFERQMSKLDKKEKLIKQVIKAEKKNPGTMRSVSNQIKRNKMKSATALAFATILLSVLTGAFNDNVPMLPEGKAAAVVAMDENLMIAESANEHDEFVNKYKISDALGKDALDVTHDAGNDVLDVLHDAGNDTLDVSHDAGNEILDVTHDVGNDALVVPHDVGNDALVVPHDVGTGLDPSASEFYGTTIQEKVWFALRNKGYSEIAVAGAMGNIDYESNGFNPNQIEFEHEVGIGLCQWSFERRAALEDFAKSRGKDWRDEDIQVEFLTAELTEGGGADGYANYNVLSNRGYTAADWIDASTVAKSAEAFCHTFERPTEEAAEKSMPKRIAAADGYFELFRNKTVPEPDGMEH